MKDIKIIADSIQRVTPISIGDDGIERELNIKTGEFEHVKNKSSK